MLNDSDNMADRHRRVCKTFGDQVRAVSDQWQAPSPCSDWNARGVLEHVIGFHDVLLLRPLGAKPKRPKDDPVGRWTATFAAIDQLLDTPGLFGGVVNVPAVGNNPPTQIDARRIIPSLSLDVLIHAWDLGRAAAHEVILDADLCRRFLDALPTDESMLGRTGMYAAPRPVSDGSDAQAELLARLGRDPNWSPDR